MTSLLHLRTHYSAASKPVGGEREWLYHSVFVSSAVLAGSPQAKKLMATPSYDNGREEIRLLVHKINDAWLHYAPQKIPAILNECFADDLVIKDAEFKDLSRGKAAGIKTYQDFVQQAEVRHCSFSEPEVDIFGHTATATYFWDMVYSLNRRTYHETGHELFVFSRIAGHWRAVWRAVLPTSRLEQLKAVPHY